jgi:DNA-binding IclR family transcriptional regulator
MWHDAGRSTQRESMTPSTRRNDRMHGAQALRRGISVVRIVARLQRRNATLREIAREAVLPKSTTFRLLRSLCEERMLTFDDGTLSYCVGPLAYELGLATPEVSRVGRGWTPLLQSIAGAVGATAFLMARSDLDAVCVGQVQPLAAIRAVPLEIGDRLPLGLGPAGLAILSALEDDEVELILRSNRDALKLYGPRATVDFIRKGVEATRRDGFGYTEGTFGYPLRPRLAGVIGVGLVVSNPQLDHAPLAISVALVGAGLDDAARRRIVRVMQRELAAARGR